MLRNGLGWEVSTRIVAYEISNRKKPVSQTITPEVFLKELAAM